MQRHTPDTPADAGNTTATEDPDRPTLKRHTPEDAKRAHNGSTDIPGVTASPALNDDPNRPNLHHGKPTSAMNETDLPKLTGIPANLYQMVAVSDAVNRDPHPFILEWDDEAQHKAILEKMQSLARAQLAAYGSTPKPQTPTPTPPAKQPTPTTATAPR